MPEDSRDAYFDPDEEFPWDPDNGLPEWPDDEGEDED